VAGALKKLVNDVLRCVGLEVRRRPDLSLPFIHKFALDDREIQFWITNQHAKRWWHKPLLEMNAEFRSLKSFCIPGSTVIEVGAHHGVHTVAMGNWVGDTGHVYALEANGDNALTLYANVALNNLNNCTCRHAVVGAVSGKIKLDGETVATKKHTGTQTTVISLDDYCTEFDIANVDLLKIDVEGYEAQVLKGARKIMSQRPKIALELHLDDIASYGSSVNEIAELIGIDDYYGEMMIRAKDWETLYPFQSITDFPQSGIVNLFMIPRSP